MLHRFSQDIGSIALPEKFTYPFHYQPHPLCLLAAGQLQSYLATQTRWSEELSCGKMFGVLVVRDAGNQLGFVAAFSGNLEGRNLHSYFVPPVFDMLQTHDFFISGVKEISAMNERIDHLEADPAYHALCQQQQEAVAAATRELYEAKEAIRADKALRDAQRLKGVSAEILAELQLASQRQKGAYKRLERKLKEELEQMQEKVNRFTGEIQQLKQRRKTQSAALQYKLFDSFQMRNIRGEEKGLCAIFADTVQKIPPAGAGECAAPKMLQYAFVHGLQPVVMAEFWWGASPKTEVRHHGRYYPACKGKCEPILGHMLQGMELDENPLIHLTPPVITVDIVYEDDYLMVVHKPSGLLSVPGKFGQECVVSCLSRQSPDYESLIPVHRLDMDTSGLLLLAKTPGMLTQLQAMFKKRTVEKRYIALLSGVLQGDKGEITLPLSQDYLNRPRQQVDYEHGKPALTRWEVLERTATSTRVAFYPVTGRSHQLRVHSAHIDGLGCPIVGDRLYGIAGTRLYLHAESLSFTHPATGQKLVLTQEPDF